MATFFSFVQNSEVLSVKFLEKLNISDSQLALKN